MLIIIPFCRTQLTISVTGKRPQFDWAPGGGNKKGNDVPDDWKQATVNEEDFPTVEEAMSMSRGIKHPFNHSAASKSANTGIGLNLL